MAAVLDAKRLDAGFYARPVVEVARDLIGCVLVHRGAAGVIVETEAYHESEPACHAYNGPTPRASMLFAQPGTAYVYLSYGIHTLLNAVVEPAGTGAAVLVRALEPIAGIELMRSRRGQKLETKLCSGPAKLTQALGIELAHNGDSLVDGPITIHEPANPGEHRKIEERTRIGISKAIDLPWRYVATDSPHLSVR